MRTLHFNGRSLHVDLPSSGSTHHVGASVIKYSLDEPLLYVSSPMKLRYNVSVRRWAQDLVCTSDMNFEGRTHVMGMP